MAGKLSRLRFGMIGMSEGNGHPYSWSAIFNGYEPAFMKDCPFPVIPGYLAKQKFPEDGLGHLGQVTQVWCQEKKMAEHISAASNIEHIAANIEDMIGHVDAVLLARDDAEKHYEMALPFLKAGLPIFIDKPLAVKISEAEKIWAAQQFGNQVFSCSSLRYADELMLSAVEREMIGEICMVEGAVMKKWETYGIHILEPVLCQIPGRGRLKAVKSIGNPPQKQVLVQWDKVIGCFKTTGELPTSLEIKFYGTRGNITKTFSDSFNAFKNSLAEFVNVIHNPEQNIPCNETEELVTILEQGAT
jgi:hypothetical protein